MRETMLHFDRVLNECDRQELCAAFEHKGGNCNATVQSAKPHLLFVAYDENRLSLYDLVRIATGAGHRAQLVDL